MKNSYNFVKNYHVKIPGNTFCFPENFEFKSEWSVGADRFKS